MYHGSTRYDSLFKDLSPFGRKIMQVVVSDYERKRYGHNVLTPLENTNNFGTNGSMGAPRLTTQNHNYSEILTSKSYANENNFPSNDNFVSLLASQVEFFADTQIQKQNPEPRCDNSSIDPFCDDIFDANDEHYVNANNDSTTDEINVYDKDKRKEVMYSNVDKDRKYATDKRNDPKNLISGSEINKKTTDLINDNLSENNDQLDKLVTNGKFDTMDRSSDNICKKNNNGKDLDSRKEVSDNGVTNVQNKISVGDWLDKFVTNGKCDSINRSSDNICKKNNNGKDLDSRKALPDNGVTNAQNKTSVVDRLSKFAAPKKVNNPVPEQTVIMLDALQVDLSNNENSVINSRNEDYIDAAGFLNGSRNDDLERKSANYFPSQEVLSQKVWHLISKPSPTPKTGNTVSKRKLKNDNQNNEIRENNPKQSYAVEIDVKERGPKRKLNQLKVSDMLPARKKKQNTPKPKPKNTKINRNVNQWLDTINEFIDTEVVNDFGLMNDQDIDKLVDDELNAMKSDDLIEESDTTDAGQKDLASCNTVQTVLANNNGKMSYKKHDVSSTNEKTGVNNSTAMSVDNSAAKVKRRSKFIPPSQRCVTKIEVNFEIKDLTEKDMTTIKDIISSSSSSTEIGFTILFRDNFCQMDQISSTTDKPCIPNDILFYVASPCGDTKYYFFKIHGMAVSEKESIKLFITEIMTASNVKKICYEAQAFIMLLFDLFRYKSEDVCLKWDIIDPKIGCFLLDPDNPPTSFSNILSHLSLNKDFEITNTNCPKQKAAYYLSLLSESCKRLYEMLMENNLWKVFVSMETRLITILSVMESRGICIDPTVLSEMETVLNNKLKDIEKKAYAAAGKYFQLNSPMQLRKILFDELQLDVKHNITIKETLKLGVKSTSETVLRSLVSLHPLPGLVLNHRNIHKAKATFVDAILQQYKNGVIRTNWEQTSAATGRIVSCNPNLQAFPKQPLVLELFPGEGFTSQCVPLRNAFIPRPGHTFVAADFQHIECRVFAHLTQDKVLMENFMQDVDIFTALAMKWMNKKTADEILPDDRNKTKHLVYALMYGAGAQKLSEILNMEISQTSFIISKFLASFPSLRTFKEKILKQCREQNGVLHSIYGRVRRFQNINSFDQMQRAYCERQAINFVIQGSAADLCKLAMIATEYRLSNLPQPLGHHLLLQIHDELVWEVPDDNVTTFIEVVQEVMQNSGEFCGELSVPLPVSIVKGKSWGQMS